MRKCFGAQRLRSRQDVLGQLDSLKVLVGFAKPLQHCHVTVWRTRLGALMTNHQGRRRHANATREDMKRARRRTTPAGLDVVNSLARKLGARDLSQAQASFKPRLPKEPGVDLNPGATTPRTRGLLAD